MGSPDDSKGDCFRVHWDALSNDELDRLFDLKTINHAEKTPDQMRERRILGSILKGLNRVDARELAGITEKMPRLSPADDARFKEIVYQQKGLNLAEARELIALQAAHKAACEPFVQAAQRDSRSNKQEGKMEPDPNWPKQSSRLQELERIIYDRRWNDRDLKIADWQWGTLRRVELVQSGEVSNLVDAWLEKTGPKQFVTIYFGGNYEFDEPVQSPLSRGIPPEWATGWGSSNAFGVFVDIDSLRFLWHPAGFWVCDVSQCQEADLGQLVNTTGACLVEDDDLIRHLCSWNNYRNLIFESLMESEIDARREGIKGRLAQQIDTITA